jgi:asparagine synthase (glutamine-hydrolysing)
MSGFAVVYERSNTPIEPGVLDRLLQRLQHRGPDGCDSLFANHVHMGHWHFWTTPEDLGEKQPLTLNGLPFTIVFDGRLDNRLELLSSLGLDSREKKISDAALVLSAYEYWGEKCFEHFIGEYSLVIYDQYKGDLLCARDALGDRSLFYSIKGTRVVIASEPWAVAGAENSKPELDEIRIAHYFANSMPMDGRTFFKGITEMMPAQVVVFGAAGERKWTYWEPDASSLLLGRSDQEYAEEFRSLLEESVRCRMRSSTSVGVLMSGGLDSTSVAALAAKMMAPEPLTTISYVFDELVECDERYYVDMMRERWGIRSIQIPCDDAWTFKGWKNWRHSCNQPEGTVYRINKERAYARAREEGIRVLLTGAVGDALYTPGVEWLSDLVLHGRLKEAVYQLKLNIQNKGWKKTWEQGYIKIALRRFVESFLPFTNRLVFNPGSMPWLSALSEKLLSGSEKKPLSRRLQRYSLLLSLEYASGCSREVFTTSRHAVELRHPYRDRRLLEYVLRLPAYQLYFDSRYKHILRVAMEGILPEAIRTRILPTSWRPLLNRGLEREFPLLDDRFRNPDPCWLPFIDADWLEHCWDSNVLSSLSDDKVLQIFWLCISFEAWHHESML